MMKLKGLGTSLRYFLDAIVIGASLSLACASIPQTVVPSIPVPTRDEVYAQAPNCEREIINFGLSIPTESSCDGPCLNKIGDAAEEAIKCVQDDSAYWEDIYIVLRAKVDSMNKRTP